MAVTNIQLSKSISELLAKSNERQLESHKEHLELKHSIDKVAEKLDKVVGDMKELSAKISNLEGRTLNDGDSLWVKVTKNSDDIRYIKDSFGKQKAYIWKLFSGIIVGVISALVIYYLIDKK